MTHPDLDLLTAADTQTNQQHDDDNGRGHVHRSGRRDATGCGRQCRPHRCGGRRDGRGEVNIIFAIVFK